MLARENRLRSAEDFRSTMRLGQKATSQHMVVYLNNDPAQSTPRFGFVVGKTVGNAVQRNLVKRRSRSALHNRFGNFQAGDGLVLRALPGLAELSWEDFSKELDSLLFKLSRGAKS